MSEFQYQQPGGNQAGASPMAVVALVLGIVSWVLCGPFFSVPGAIVAKIELGKIQRGESPAAGKTIATVGFWLSVVNVVVFCLLMCLYVVLFAGVIAMGPVQGR